MTSINTQISTQQEYLRSLANVEKGVVISASVFPMTAFRVTSEDFNNAVIVALKKVNKHLKKCSHDIDTVNNYVNFHINEEMINLDNQGKIIHGEKFQGIVNQVREETYNGNRVVTDDGYVFFNPGVLPPTITNTRH